MYVYIMCFVYKSDAFVVFNGRRNWFTFFYYFLPSSNQCLRLHIRRLFSALGISDDKNKFVIIFRTVLFSQSFFPRDMRERIS